MPKGRRYTRANHHQIARSRGAAMPSITLDIYGHLYHEMQGDAARIMDELVTPIRVDLSDVSQKVQFPK